MTNYSQQAINTWKNLAPTAYEQIEDKEAFFNNLGELAADRVDQLSRQIAGDDPEDETYFQKVGRLNMAKLQAEEIVRHEILTPTPEYSGYEKEEEDDLIPPDPQWEKILQELDEEEERERQAEQQAYQAFLEAPVEEQWQIIETHSQQEWEEFKKKEQYRTEYMNALLTLPEAERNNWIQQNKSREMNFGSSDLGPRIMKEYEQVLALPPNQQQETLEANRQKRWELFRQLEEFIKQEEFLGTRPREEWETWRDHNSPLRLKVLDELGRL